MFYSLEFISREYYSFKILEIRLVILSFNRHGLDFGLGINGVVPCDR